MNECWQVKIGDGECEADTETLKQWIVEGRIQPVDKVKRGNLNWIDAARVPELRKHFTITSPDFTVPSGTEAGLNDHNKIVLAGIANQDQPADQGIYQSERLGQIVNAVCYYHQEIRPDFICTQCGYGFCHGCGKLVGVGNVPVCQFCGGLCHKYQQARARAELLLDQQQRFGVEDIKLALLHPFDYLLQMGMISVLFGACLFFGFSGFPFATLLAYAILFTCTSMLIRRVMTGDQDHRHLFDLSNLLIDLIGPMIIGLALILITTGPYELYHFLYHVKVQAGGGGAVFQLVFSKFHAFFRPIINPVTIPLILWAICYYPLALLVAGITESFTSIINPLEGFRMARRLGESFPRIFLAYLAISALGGSVTGIMLYILLPHLVTLFASAIFIPFLNVVFLLALAAMVAAPILYTNLAIAFMLGRALFKSADRLGIVI